MANYAWTTGQSLPEIENNKLMDGWNLAQREPNTAIFTGKTGLTFKDCNLTNCIVPVDSVLIGCCRGNVSYCSHEHERWIAKGLPECAVDCSHLVDTDEIYVDGALVDIIRHYKDTEL